MKKLSIVTQLWAWFLGLTARGRKRLFLEGLHDCRIRHRAGFKDLCKVDEIARQKRVRMEDAFSKADTPAQRLFAWCPWCDTEMVSARARHWFSTRNLVWYFQCPKCKRRSRWIFDDGRVEECLDQLPSRVRP